MGKNCLLIRLFSKEEYAKQLMNGIVRMMPLEYYREMECDRNGRKDLYEGIQSLYLGEHTIITIDGVPFTGNDGLISVRWRYGDYDKNTKIYCCTLLFIEEDGTADISSIEEFDLPYCVVFTNPDEFVLRFESATKEINGEYRRVTYYNSKLYNGEINEFMKRSEYEWQNEFRFKVATEGNAPYFLNVGDIHDITHLFKTKDFIEALNKIKCNK